MKLSTKGRYAARAMLELAAEYGKGHMRLHEIAKRQDISVKYLERMMSALVSSGLVTSIRGQKGGYILAKPPEEILLGHVIFAVEGSTAPVDCVDFPSQCSHSPKCVTRGIWKEVKDAIDGVLDSYTLADLVEMDNNQEV